MIKQNLGSEVGREKNGKKLRQPFSDFGLSGSIRLWQHVASNRKAYHDGQV